jgi:type 1 fimbria pilin
VKTVQPFIVLIVVVLCAGSVVIAQVDVATATLRGTIADPSGAVVAGASVSVVSVERGLSRQASMTTMSIRLDGQL